MKTHWLWYSFALIAGISIGISILVGTALLPLHPDTPFYTWLGIRKPHVIGFLPYWLLSRATGPYQEYLTEYGYFGLAVSADGTLQKLVNPQEEEPGWTKLNGDAVTPFIGKNTKHRLATSLLVHLADEDIISRLLTDPVTHAHNLVNDAAPVMERYGFGDLNLDIESFREASPSMQAAYTEFVRAVRSGVAEKQLGTLTLEVPAASFIKPFMTDPAQVAPLVDRVVIMAYDFHYSGSYIAGPVAPLDGVPQWREIDVETILVEALRTIPREKVILGIPLYGYQWETLSKAPGAATIPGSAATASNRRMTEHLASCPACMTLFDEPARAPVVVEATGSVYLQTFYEDSASITEKIALAKRLNAGGVALWALGYEGDGMLDPLADYKRSFRFVQ